MSLPLLNASDMLYVALSLLGVKLTWTSIRFRSWMFLRTVFVYLVISVVGMYKSVTRGTQVRLSVLISPYSLLALVQLKLHFYTTICTHMINMLAICKYFRSARPYSPHTTV